MFDSFINKWVSKKHTANDDGKKLFFMHIAKTAGSSVNKWIAEHFPEDKVINHIQTVSADMVDKYEFMSGHLRLAAIRNSLPRENWETFTVVRDPLDHVISHLCWVKRLAEPENASQHENHPEFVKNLIRKLVDTDLSDPKSLNKFVDNMGEEGQILFDNCQSKYFTNIPMETKFKEILLKTAEHNLAQFDVIGTTENLDEALAKLAVRMGWNAPKKTPQENRNNNKYYGMDKTNPELVAALEPLITFDKIIYNKITQIPT